MLVVPFGVNDPKPLDYSPDRVEPLGLLSNKRRGSPQTGDSQFSYANGLHQDPAPFPWRWKLEDAKMGDVIEESIYEPSEVPG